MTNTFYTADVHMGHKQIINYEPEFRDFQNVEEHDEHIIKNWNSVVNPNDTVWILGDMVINKKNLHRFRELNGRKLLVMGNHDNFNKEWFDTVLMDVVDRPFGCVEKRFGGIRTVFTHIPVHPCQLERRFDFNLHGHLHSSTVSKMDGSGEDDLRFLNLSMEHWNLTPVPFDTIKRELEDRHQKIG